MRKIEPLHSPLALPPALLLFARHKYGQLLAVLVWVFVVSGILLRVFHYIDNRSLWIDEIYLITSILKTDFMGLTQPELAYQQKAPIGFLWLVKLSVILLGEDERALRLVPLLCGIASLFAFLPVARYFLKPLGVVLAMGILALAPPLVYHSVEVKQYGMELLATVLALYLYSRYHNKKDWVSLLGFGWMGAVLLWFSFSAIFILAGMAIGTSLYFLYRKRWRLLRRFLLPFSLWLVSFVINFLLFTHKHAEQEWLVNWFRVRGGFAPVDFFSEAGLLWLMKALYRLLDYPPGHHLECQRL
ncbi:glycosyltransferase family 39 protein [Cesiribacter andamanensis]|uniref:Putative membrane protein n=1 Tax=Cesiribacter andamanensis AMV16 TaxID=1279009 RepID=M7N3R4_9BACT|nr:glycosyltransferase family 39 protein [Cesiribacter andamanensis]EMR01851.1 putative membrane protein [Cesiribacter andamanensis AMV16]